MWKKTGRSRRGCVRSLELIPTSSGQRVTSEETRGPARFPSFSDIPLICWSALRLGKWKDAHSWRMWRGEFRQWRRTVPVLVKLLPSIHERRLLWELQHVPGVPCLLGITKPFPHALVMELFPARSFLQQRFLVNPWKRLAGLQKVCEVAAALHARGVAHGDLKESNITMGETAGRMTVTLLNFGRAVHLLDLDENARIEYLLRDLKQLYELLTQLNDLFCVRAYTNFLKILETRFKNNQPASASQMAAGIACIITLHPHRPFYAFDVLLKGKDNTNISFSFPRSVSSSQPFTTLTLDSSLAWPPRDSSFEVFSWSEVSLRPHLKGVLVARKGKLLRGESVVPVTVKVRPQDWEQHVLHTLQDVPGVPALLGVIEEPPAALVMEDYKGKTFRQLRDTWQVRTCLAGLIQACLTLDTLHARGIIHGRLTSRNILIHADKDTFSATLINFESCCSFRSMKEPWPDVLLRHELRCLSLLVHSLSCLVTVPEYRHLRAALTAGLAAGNPVAAKEVAKQLQDVQERLGGWPWIFGCCRPKKVSHPTSTAST